MGRHTEFTDEIEQQALAYIDGGYIAVDDQVIPSIVGLAIYLNVNKSTLYKWAEDGHGDFSNTLGHCQDMQHRILLNSGLTGDFNSVITKLALHNHGHSDKVVTDVTSGGEKLNNYIVNPVTTAPGSTNE